MGDADMGMADPEPVPHGDLNPAQRRIWTLAQIGQHDTFGHPILEMDLAGPLEIGVLRETLSQAMRHHPALRTRFRVLAGGQVVQRIDETAALNLMLEDAAVSSLPNPAALLLAGVPTFHLDTDLPFRATLVRHDPDHHSLFLTLHPIVADGESLAILARELQAGLSRVGTDGFPAKHAPRGDHAPARRGTLAFWRNWLADTPEDGALPTPPRVDDGRGSTRGTVAVTFEAETSRALAACASVLGQPLDMLLLSAFAVLLRRYGSPERLRMGVVRRADTAHTAGIGRIEDVMPVKAWLDGALRFSDVVEQLARSRALADENPLPFETLAQAFWTNNGENGSGFLQAIHVHRPPMPAPLRTANGLVITCLDRQRSRTDANLVLTTGEEADGRIVASLNHAGDLCAPGLLEQALRHLGRIVAAASRDPAILLRDIALLDAADLALLSTPYPDAADDDPRPVHALIAEHGRRRPEARAIMHGDRVWTHGDLERFANRLAHKLVAAGAGPERCVAVAVRRSPEAIGAILAVLKAGAAFVPVDPDHPRARNDHVLRDARVALAVTAGATPGLIPAGVTAVDIAQPGFEDGPDHDPARPVTDEQLAYVIYTSGSTGLPKGVAVEHGPLTRHCQATARVYDMSAASCELPFLPFSSDGGHERWIVPLMAGGSIVLPDKPLWTPEETFAAMRRHGVNNASFPTTYVQQLAEWAEAMGDPPPMRLYSFGGEGMARATFELFSRALKAEWLINGYGPTETIMTPMVWKVRAGTPFEGVYAPIGRPVGRRRAYVLDHDLNPVPIGVTGELFLGGDGVARGYLGRSGLTADRFIPDPFDPGGGRLYRSGDLARWRADGSVEFMGRVDHQVKLRGFRIEPGEIEAVLRALPGVSECAVLLRQDGGQPMLVGYVVAGAAAALDPLGLQRLLAQQLPDYMVPSAIVPLDRMPLNANGKLDRAALPSPALRAAAIEPPVGATEEQLCTIWRDVLGLEAVGVTQNFFETGGNSMAALRVLGRIKAAKPGTPLAIADLFNHQTVRELAKILDEGRTDGRTQLIHLRGTGTRPMLYCFPGLLVSTREYVRLVDHLGPDQPATGFICYSLAEQVGPAPAVADITARYAEEIRRRSRGRPCAFLGWSWGGLLAYETARMLKDDVDLKLIGMIDVCDMDTDFAIGAIPQFAAGERSTLHGRVQAWLARTPMGARWRDLLGDMDIVTYDQFLRFVGNSADDLPEDGPDIGSREHTFWVLIENGLIFRRHRMAPHDCPIQPWAAADTLNRGLNLIDWRTLSRHAAPAEVIEGTTHLHIIGAPAFHRRFARRLNAAFIGLAQAAE